MSVANTFKKFAVFLHLGNYGMWKEIQINYLDRLKNEDYDLWISIPRNQDESNKELIDTIMIYNKNIKILVIPNKGFDIGGFFYCLQKVIDLGFNYDFIIKLHTKSDTLWRDSMSLPLLDIKKLDDLFKDPDIGMVGGQKFFMIGNMSGDCRNQKHFEDILERFNFINNQNPFNFVAGNIFAIKFSVLINIYKTHIEWILNKLNDENSYDPIWMKLNNETIIGNLLWKGADNKNYIRDGMFEHAFERFFSYSIKYTGYKTIQI